MSDTDDDTGFGIGRIRDQLAHGLAAGPPSVAPSAAPPPMPPPPPPAQRPVAPPAVRRDLPRAAVEIADRIMIAAGAASPATPVAPATPVNPVIPVAPVMSPSAVPPPSPSRAAALRSATIAGAASRVTLLPGQAITVGRGAGPDRLQVAGSDVSTGHLRIAATDAGLFVTDLQSTNGTELRSRGIVRVLAPNVPQELSPGDSMLVPDGTFLCEVLHIEVAS